MKEAIDHALPRASPHAPHRRFPKGQAPTRRGAGRGRLPVGSRPATRLAANGSPARRAPPLRPGTVAADPHHSRPRLVDECPGRDCRLRGQLCPGDAGTLPKRRSKLAAPRHRERSASRPRLLPGHRPRAPRDRDRPHFPPTIPLLPHPGGGRPRVRPAVPKGMGAPRSSPIFWPGFRRLSTSAPGPNGSPTRPDRSPPADPDRGPFAADSWVANCRLVSSEAGYPPSGRSPEPGAGHRRRSR